MCVREIKRKRETDGERWKTAYACMRVMIGVIGAVGGVERQGVVAVEGTCRLVIGVC